MLAVIEGQPLQRGFISKVGRGNLAHRVIWLTPQYKAMVLEER